MMAMVMTMMMTAFSRRRYERSGNGQQKSKGENATGKLFHEHSYEIGTGELLCSNYRKWSLTDTPAVSKEPRRVH